MNKLQVFQHSGLSTGCSINMGLDDYFTDFELNNYELFKFMLMAAEISNMDYDYSVPLEHVMAVMYGHYLASPDFSEIADPDDYESHLSSYIAENSDKIKNDIIEINLPELNEGYQEELENYVSDLLPVYSVAYALIAFVDGVKSLSIPYDHNLELAYLVHTHLNERFEHLTKTDKFRDLNYHDYLVETVPMNEIALSEFCKRFSD